MLKTREISGAKSIGLGNDGNEVDTRAQALHNLNIQRLQGVSGWADEIQAGVYTHIDLVCTPRLLLLQHVRLVLVVEKLDDRLPGIAVVDIVTKSRGINNSQANYTAQFLLAVA